METSRLTRDGTAEPVSETKFSGANGDWEILIFPVQLTPSRIGNLTRLIHALAICVTIHSIRGTRATRELTEKLCITYPYQSTQEFSMLHRPLIFSFVYWYNRQILLLMMICISVELYRASMYGHHLLIAE